MAEKQIFTQIIDENQAGERLDVLTAALADVTRSRAGTLIRDGLVLVGGVPQTKAGFKPRCGDELRVELPEAAPARVEAQDIPLEIR